MKNLYKILPLILSGVILFNSCSDIAFNDSFLDGKPENVGETLDDMFESEYFANQILTTSYSYLPMYLSFGWDSCWNAMRGGLSEELTDIAHSYSSSSGATNLYYTGAYNASTTTNYEKYSFTGDGVWESIRYAYLYLENVDKVPDMTDELKAQRKAEAKTILALQYYEMLSNMGGIVWADSSMDIEDLVNFDGTRLSVRASLEKIIGLLDEAIVDLPWNYTVYESGRMSRASARALKVRALLFVASPLFNNDEPYHAEANDLTWLGAYDETLWTDAKTAVEEFMDDWNANGYYEISDGTNGETAESVQVDKSTSTLTKFGKLRNGYINGYWLRGSTENLISIRTNDVNGDTWQRYSGSLFYRATDYGFAVNCPTLEYFEMFPQANGEDFPEDFDWSNPSSDPFGNRDPRLFENIVIPGDYYSPIVDNMSNVAQSYEGGAHSFGVANSSGFRLRKWALEYGTSSLYGVASMYQAAHNCYMRLPEIYLAYAEILNHLNNGPTEEACQMVDVVRARVGLPEISRSMNQDEFLEFVLRERAIELGFEDVRWYDIIRYKRSDLLTKPLHGLKITLDSNATYGYTFEEVELPTRYWQKSGNWDNKWFLSVFPQDELVKDYGLEQNPGW